MACDICRVKKVRCNGQIPCEYCKSHKTECTYPPTARRRKTPDTGVFNPHAIKKRKMAEGRMFYHPIHIPDSSPQYVESRLNRMESMLSQVISAKELSSLQHASIQYTDPLLAQEHPSPSSDIHIDHVQRTHLPLHVENRLDRMESLLEHMVGEIDGAHVSSVVQNSSPEDHFNVPETTKQRESLPRDVPLDPALFVANHDENREQRLGYQAQTQGLEHAGNRSDFREDDQIDPSLLDAANASSALQAELSIDPALA